MDKQRNIELSMNMGISIAGSLIASLLFYILIPYSSYFVKALSQYSFGLLTWFGNAKIKQAATLEPLNYSFYILIFFYLLVIFSCIILFHLRKKNISIERKTSNRIQKIFNVLLTIIIIIILVLGLIFIMGESMVLNDITDFNHNIRILTPYITGTEKDIIISEWSQMVSFADYKNIYKKLHELAKNQNIELRFNKFY